ncbi:helix-turn-helix domain-containing protein [Patescibacteria group bacterium]
MLDLERVTFQGERDFDPAVSAESGGRASPQPIQALLASPGHLVLKDRLFIAKSHRGAWLREYIPPNIGRVMTLRGYGYFCWPSEERPRTLSEIGVSICDDDCSFGQKNIPGLSVLSSRVIRESETACLAKVFDSLVAYKNNESILTLLCGGKERQFLALLARHFGEPIPVDYLIRSTWDDRKRVMIERDKSLLKERISGLNSFLKAQVPKINLRVYSFSIEERASWGFVLQTKAVEGSQVQVPLVCPWRINDASLFPIFREEVIALWQQAKVMSGERLKFFFDPQERALFGCLLANFGQIASHQQIEKAFWPDDPPRIHDYSGVVHQIAMSLRKKLGPKFAVIGVRGEGYRLVYCGQD